jgi:hypothetical protein
VALPASERQQLRRARDLLESGSLVARLAETIGRPLEAGLRRLPAPARDAVHGAARGALDQALHVALGTLDGRPRPASERLHKAVAAATGAAGGFFGNGGLAVELPVTTVVMLRSIADVARSEGHDLADPGARLACLEVFALGEGAAGSGTETGYYAVRAGLSRALEEAARHLAQRGMSAEGAPALVRLLAAVAARFGVVVEEKIALASVPVIGALSGSLVNALFIDHFQKRARGHFVVRRLENLHGYDVVRQAYEAVGDASRATRPRAGDATA